MRSINIPSVLLHIYTCRVIPSKIWDQACQKIQEKRIEFEKWVNKIKKIQRTFVFLTTDSEEYMRTFSQKWGFKRHQEKKNQLENEWRDFPVMGYVYITEKSGGRADSDWHLKNWGFLEPCH